MATTSRGGPRVLSIDKIWERGLHNAFTDLIRFRGRWYCCFREGTSHVSGDGRVRVIASADGERWASVCVLSSGWEPLTNLCDPKLCIGPDGRLMLMASAWNPCWPEQEALMCQSMVWLSDDGQDWGEPVRIGDLNWKFWRVVWHDGAAFAVACPGAESERGRVQLYQSADGLDWQVLAPNLSEGEHPNEAELLFAADGTCLCLLRRNYLAGDRAETDGWTAPAHLGIASAPYQNWSWQALGRPVGGPAMIQLPDERVLAAVRLWHGRGWDEQHLALCWVEPAPGRLTEFLELPSGGDSTYAGLVFHDDVLFVSYYSSHEGKACIYLARVAV